MDKKRAANNNNTTRRLSRTTSLSSKPRTRSHMLHPNAYGGCTGFALEMFITTSFPLKIHDKVREFIIKKIYATNFQLPSTLKLGKYQFNLFDFSDTSKFDTSNPVLIQFFYKLDGIDQRIHTFVFFNNNIFNTWRESSPTPNQKSYKIIMGKRVCVEDLEYASIDMRPTIQSGTREQILELTTNPTVGLIKTLFGLQEEHFHTSVNTNQRYQEMVDIFRGSTIVALQLSD